MGFKGATVSVPPLPVDHARTRVTVSAGGETRLPCCHATDLVIEGVSPSAYTLDPRRGVITATQDIDASATYTATAHRYDAFGSKGYVAGTPRFVDPEEWGATGELYRLYVSRFGVEVIPVHAYRDGVRLDQMAEHQAWLSASRKLLGGVLQRPGLKVMTYGHSIPAMGYRVPSQMVEANGPARDVPGYFETYPTDTRALFDGLKAHTREGYAYRLVERLNNPTYLNFSIAGSRSDDQLIPGDSHPYGSGAYPARLARALELKPDVVILDFGMNDLGMPRVYESHVAILDAFRSAGAARIVMTPQVEHPAYRDRLPAVQLVRDQIAMAARDTGSVLVDTTALYLPGEEGAMGLSRWSYCAATLSTHPGRSELHAAGRLLASLA